MKESDNPQGAPTSSSKGPAPEYANAPAAANVSASAKMSDLPVRAASGIVLVAFAIATLWYGGHAFTLFWLAAAIIALWEWLRLVGAPRLMLAMLAGGAGIVIAAALAGQGLSDYALGMLLLGAIAAGAVSAGASGGLRLALWCGAGVLYAGLFLVALLALRMSLLYGVQAVLWLFAIVWGTDILAYFGGRSIGGPKLWPRVSPSKTWSGFICGVSGGALAGVGVAYFYLPAGQTSLIVLFVIGLLAAAISQGGDLFESSLKRHAGVKDASHIIPGHGGVMDRLDGFIFAAVFAGLIGVIKGGMLNAAAGLLLW